MSHNKIAVGGQSPDIAGDISVDLGDLSDVSTAGASANDVIEYDGASWAAAAQAAQAGLSLYAGLFQKASYGVGTYYYSFGDYRASIYSSSYVERFNSSAFNTATTTNSLITNTSWAESVDVTAGVYWVQMGVTSHSLYGQSTTWQLEGNSGAFSARATVDARNYGAQSNCILSGIYTATGPDIIRAVVVSYTGWTRLEWANQTYFTGQTIVKIG